MDFFFTGEHKFHCIVCATERFDQSHFVQSTGSAVITCAQGSRGWNWLLHLRCTAANWIGRRRIPEDPLSLSLCGSKWAARVSPSVCKVNNWPKKNISGIKAGCQSDAIERWIDVRERESGVPFCFLHRISFFAREEPKRATAMSFVVQTRTHFSA